MDNVPLELNSNYEICKYYYSIKRPGPVYVWNKLLKLSFVKENQLYNKEGLLYEDSLWTYYLLRSLNHAFFVHEITYIYHRHPGSILANTPYSERLKSFGSIHKEIADSIEPNRQQEETDNWVRNFCRYYVDAPKNPDYQHAYNEYYKKLTEVKNENALRQLVLTKRMSKSSAGRKLYRGMINVKNKIRLVIDLVS